MKLMIELNPSQNARLEKLINDGSYASAYQFVRHAIDTLLELEKSGHEKSLKDLTDLNKSVGHIRAKEPISVKQTKPAHELRKCPDFIKVK